MSTTESKLRELALTWMSQQSTYPRDRDGFVASAAVRCCARELLDALALPAASGAEPHPDTKDAARYRWLRDQHEGPSACSYAVFAPDSELEDEATLYPLGSLPGELDTAIDTALAQAEASKGADHG